VDDQIYLVPGETAPDPPAGSRRRRPWTLVVLLAVAGAAVAVQHVRASGAHQRPVMAAAAAAPGSPVRPWPTGAGACGSPLELPQVTASPPTEPVAGTVAVPGARPALVDVGSGATVPITGLTLRPDQYASVVVRSGPANYLLVRSCRRRWLGSVLRTAPGARQRVVSGARPVFGLVGDDRGGVWAEAYTGTVRIDPEAAIGTTLVRLDRPGPPVVLPQSLSVLGVHGDQVVGIAVGSAESAVRNPLYRYDLSQHRASLLGQAYRATVSRGVVFWTEAPCSATGPCQVHSYDLDSGAGQVVGYHLPLGTSVGGAVLSPDRRRLAFPLERELADPAYRSSSPENPADLVVLDRTSGELEPVPGIELAPGEPPVVLGFSTDSRWLIVGLATGDGTDLYSWRTGLSLPQATPQPRIPRLTGPTEPRPTSG